MDALILDKIIMLEHEISKILALTGNSETLETAGYRLTITELILQLEN